MIPINDLEEKYLDLLQNIEFSIVLVYRRNPDLTDHNVDMALETLGKKYQGKNVFPPQNPVTLEVYETVQDVCDWRLGDAILINENSQPVDIPLEPVSREVIIACLHRLRKSVRTWTKQGGRQGYLYYIEQFLP